MTPFFYFAFTDKLYSLTEEIIGALIVVLSVWMWDRWRSHSAWKKKKFTNRVILSLNCLTTETIKQADGTTVSKPALRLRTIFEKDVQDAFHNNFMADLVNKAIHEVQKSDPILRFNKEDSWYVLNAVLNQIAEQFADGTVKRDMGLPVTTKQYLFCLTYELEGDIRALKPRIMMIEKDNLLSFPETDDFILESSHHSTRVKTLRFLKEEYKKNPYLFMKIEISF